MSRFRAPSGTPAGAIALVLALVGCGGGSGVYPSPQPTAAEQAVVPEGWKTLATDENDIRLVVPPDIELVHAAPGSMLAQAPMRDGVIPFEVSVQRPGEELGAPDAGQSFFDYLQERGWLPRAEEGVGFGSTVERETFLPAGRAFELRTSVQPGTPEEGRVAAYLIETRAGLALLRFAGVPAGMEERHGQIELMARLVEFGIPPAPGSTGE